MNSIDENTRVFIVRLWREPEAIEGAEPKWRGWIEYVATNERQYVKSLEEISAVIGARIDDWNDTKRPKRQ